MATLRSGGVALAVLALSGCAYGPDPQRIAFLNSMIGVSQAELIRRAGPPQREFRSGGHTFLAYDVRANDYMSAWEPFGAWSPPQGMPTTPPEILERGCETAFELADGRVLGWTERGTQCR